MRFEEFDNLGPVFARWLVRKEARLAALPSTIDDQNAEVARLHVVSKSYPFGDRAGAIDIALDAAREAKRAGLADAIVAQFEEAADELSRQLQSDEDQWLAKV